MNEAKESQPLMTAIVLAGQRDGEDALSQFAAAPCKAVVEIGGRPMLLRVIETLAAASQVEKISLSGPDKDKLSAQDSINALIESGDISWSAPQATPSRSAYAGMCDLPEDAAVLLTTADHPLLSVTIVDEFCRQCGEQEADVVIGLAPYSLVRDAFPEMKKTVLRFRDAELCGCNLFAFLTPAGRQAAKFWRQLEAERKKPLRVIRFLGWSTLLKYALGRLSLEEAIETFSNKLGLRINAVILPYADAAVDVDSIEDYQMVQGRFQAQ